MDAARADDDEQPIVAAVEDVADFAAAAHDRALALLAERQVADQRLRRDQLHDPLDPLVADPVTRLLRSDHHLAAAFLHIKTLLSGRASPCERGQAKRAKLEPGARPNALSVRHEAAGPDA